MLLGVELLQCAGLHNKHLQRPIRATDALLGNLAGNAFSAFAALPLFAALFSVAHTTSADFPAHSMLLQQTQGADDDISNDSDALSDESEA